MLRFQNVSKYYKLKGVRKDILTDFTFEFPADKNVGIMGKNGVGKSTFMRLMAGTEPPDQGHIYRSLRVSWPLGFTGGFNGTMTGLENIRFVARIYGQNPQRVIDYVQDFSDLGKSLKLPIKSYSSGMRARLAFGLSMAISFDLYLVDEITAVGDEKFKKKSQAVFRDKLASSKIAMISHSTSTIRDYCNCGLLLEPGRVRFFEDVEDLIAAYKVSVQT